MEWFSRQLDVERTRAKAKQAGAVAFGRDMELQPPPVHLGALIMQVLELDEDRRLGYALPALDEISPFLLAGLKSLERARGEAEAGAGNANPLAPLTPEQEAEQDEVVRSMMRQ